MTEEQILQLAENHLTLEKWEDICWKADTLQLLKFAREMYNKGQEEEIRRQKTGIGYVNGVLTLDEF